MAPNMKHPTLCIKAHCGQHRPVQRIGACDFLEPPRREDFATEIFPWLYLGCAKDAANHTALRQRGIRFIVNATREVHSPDGETEMATGFQYLKLDLEDSADQPIAQYFDQTHQFIEDARARSQKVLVHCRRGISRSATLVIAYVMRYALKSFDEAFDFVKQKRDMINPNLGFMLALEALSPTPSEDSPASSFGPLSEEEDDEEEDEEEDELKGDYVVDLGPPPSP
jgi:hypothetical protein